MFRPGLQIYLRPLVTLTFDVLTPEVDRCMSLPRGPLVPIGIEIESFIFTIYHSQFGNGRTDRRMDEWTGREHYASLNKICFNLRNTSRQEWAESSKNGYVHSSPLTSDSRRQGGMTDCRIIPHQSTWDHIRPNTGPHRTTSDHI